MTPETEQNGAALEAPRPGTVAPSIAPATVPILTPEIIEAAKRITTKAYADPGDHAYDARTVAMALLSVAALSQPPGEAAEQIADEIYSAITKQNWKLGGVLTMDRPEGVEMIAQALTRHAAERDARVRAEIDELSHLVQAECDNAIALLRRAETAEAKVRELEAAVRWALGEIDDFPERQPGQGAYWWRSELRRRALGGSK